MYIFSISEPKSDFGYVMRGKKLSGDDKAELKLNLRFYPNLIADQTTAHSNVSAWLVGFTN